jgi:predicted kinase
MTRWASMSNLIILAGVPGCGKSTLAELFRYHYKIVSSDVIRKRLAGSLKEAHREDIKPWDVFYGEIATALQHDVDVVADATFLTVEHRQRIRDVASDCHADTHFILFKNLDEARARNAARPDETRVPPEVMEGFVDLYSDTLVRLPQECYSSVTSVGSYR